MTLIEPVQRTAAQDYARPRTRPHVVAAAADARAFPCWTSWYRSSTSRPRCRTRSDGCTATCDQIPFTFAITVADNASTDRTRRSPRRWRAKYPRSAISGLNSGSGRGAAPRMVVVGRTGAGLHGRRPVDRSGRRTAVDRAAGVRALRHRDRHGLSRSARSMRGPKREIISRCYNLILRSTLSARLLRRPVRVQGDPRRRRGDAVAARRRHGLVLRHRTAGPGPPLRSAHPRGAGRLDRRPDSSVDIVATAVADLLGWPAWSGDSPPAPSRSALTAQFQPQPDPPRHRRCCARSCTSRRSACSAPSPSWPVPRIARRVVRRWRTSPHCWYRRRQYGRQPPVHLQGAAGMALPPPAQGHRIRHRVGADQWRLALLHLATDPPVQSKWQCWSWPTWRPPSCASSCCAGGCSDRATPPAPNPSPLSRPREIRNDHRAIARPHLRWDRIALGAILAVTARSISGDWARSAGLTRFYATAVQAGTQSWKAWLFGSLDANGNAITVDKPPVSLWRHGPVRADLRFQHPGACWCRRH